MAYESEVLAVERRGPTVWIQMRDSDQLNVELIRVFQQVSQDEEVRAVVLTGAAERAFCVGGGGAGAPKDEAGQKAYWINGMATARDVVLSILDCNKPVIGRINGHAVGKGCSIALCCDITLMVDDAKIGDTHVKVGLVAGDGGSLLWPHLVGPMLAKRFLLTGDLLTGREAETIGLVTEAVPRGELDARTDHWTGRMENAASVAVGMTKRAINAAIRAQAAAHMDMSLGLETMSYMTQDYREGVAALVEKRDPTFSGR